MSKDKQSRKFSRCEIALRVEVRLDKGVLLEGCARNISMNGLFFETERSLPLGSHVRVLLARDDGMRELRIECTGVVSRLDARGVAMEFQQVTSESLQHLHQLIRYNTEDALQVEREFEEYKMLKQSAEDSSQALDE